MILIIHDVRAKTKHGLYMQQNKFVKAISWVVVLAVVFFLGFSSGKNRPVEVQIQDQIVPVSGISVMFDYGNGTVKTFNAISYIDSASIFDVLRQLQSDKKITLKYKEYGGELGAFIEEIDGVGKDPKGEKWWQYWVNNKYSNVGVSSHKVSRGEIIEFKFVKGQQD